MFKSVVDLISEASLSDNTCIEDDVTVDEILDDWDDFEELDDDLECTAEMVTIILDESNHRALVEHDQVLKYMIANNVEDIKEAMIQIAEANSVEYADLYLVVESKEYMQQALQEAVKAKFELHTNSRLTLGNKVYDANRFVKELKDKSIKIVKKKSKKKRR